MGEGTLCTVMLGYRFNTSEAIRQKSWTRQRPSMTAKTA